jgi:hypothetical protein
VRPGVVHQDAPHQLRGHTEELGTILPARMVLINQFAIGLVDECRGLQRVLDPLVTQGAGGDAAQFPIHDRDQLREGTTVAAAPGSEQLRHVSGRRRHGVLIQIFQAEVRVYAVQPDQKRPSPALCRPDTRWELKVTRCLEPVR